MLAFGNLIGQGKMKVCVLEMTTAMTTINCEISSKENSVFAICRSQPFTETNYILPININLTKESIECTRKL